MSGIHHFVPVLHRGDAVGRHTLRLREATRARGFRSEIFVDTVDAETADETVPVLSYPEAAQAGDVVVYQFATASAMAPWLAARSETLVVNYHNITPPELMAPWDNHLALGQLRAQGDLRLLAPRAALAVADSAYNEAHLAAAGFAATAVVPPSAALDDAVTAGGPCHDGGLGPGRPRHGARWLAVGRVSPNKALESTIAALAVARAHGDPEATLRIIGKPATDSYVAALHRYVAELGLARAVRFAGHASDATVAVGLRRGRRAGRHVRARGLLRAGRRGDGRRPAGRGVRPGGGARGARRCRMRSCPTRIPTRWRLPSPPCCAMPPAARRWSRRGAGGWPSSTSRTAADRFVDLLAPLAERSCRAVTSGIHQFVPMLHRGDAVGRHTLRLRDVMAARGIPSQIYVEMDDPETASETRPFARYADEAEPGDVLVYQFATASALASWLQARVRAAGRQLPQRHAARVLRPLGQRHGAPPAAGPVGAARAGAARRARPGGVGLQRGGAARRGLRRDRRRATRRHRAHGRGRRQRGRRTFGRAAHAAPAGSASGASPRTRRSSTR